MVTPLRAGARTSTDAGAFQYLRPYTLLYLQPFHRHVIDFWLLLQESLDMWVEIEWDWDVVGVEMAFDDLSGEFGSFGFKPGCIGVKTEGVDDDLTLDHDFIETGGAVASRPVF